MIKAPIAVLFLFFITCMEIYIMLCVWNLFRIFDVCHDIGYGTVKDSAKCVDCV